MAYDRQKAISFWCCLYFFLLMSLFVICFVRAYYLQFEQHETHFDTKKRLTTSYIKIRTPRGDILDQRGYPLAMSIRSFSCCIYPKMIPKEEDKMEVARRLSRILKLPYYKVFTRLESDSQFQWLKRILSPSEEKRLRSLKASGYAFLDFVPEFERRYPGSKGLSHLLGFTGIDDQGLSGIELSCDEYIHGQEYKVYMRRDNRGNRIMPQSEAEDEISRKKNVILSIDSVIQTYTEDAVRIMVEKFLPKSAVGIVMNVHNGDILAMVSFPRFDNNHYQDYNLETMRNRVVNSIYEPGSTFKAITFAAALNEGLINGEEIIDCTTSGVYKFGPRTLRDSHPCGIQTSEGVLVHSSNIGTAKIAIELGQEKLYDYARKFGFGQKTGVFISGEENGIFRPVDKWTPYYSITSIPMGQEICVTPIQVVSAYAAMANGGIKVQPRIIQRIEMEDGSLIKEFQVQKEQRIISEAASKKLLSMLQKVVDEGTGKAAKSSIYTIGGKTGTSQKIINGVYSNDRHVGSFIGVAPIENPKIAVLVVLDDPVGKGYGGQVAAPAVKSIIENTLQYLRVPVSRMILTDNEVEVEENEP